MLLLSTLKKALELCFTLYHYNYAWWLSVFVQDLEVAYGDNPELFAQLSSHLLVTTTNAKFSRIAYDHKQENNNGYINLVNKENKSNLRKLEICLPEILPHLKSCEGKVMKNHKHKEEMPSLSISYLSDVKRVSSKITTNPFSASQFQKLNSPITLPDIIAEEAKKVFDIGNQQYQEFVKTRFVLGSEDVINSPIKL